MYRATKPIWVYSTENVAKKAIIKDKRTKSTGGLYSKAYFDAKPTGGSFVHNGKKYSFYKIASQPSSNCYGSVKDKIFTFSGSEMSKINESALKESKKLDEELKAQQQNQQVGEQSYEMDDSFAVQYSTYKQDLSDGLRVKNLRGILGMPHQFLPITDPRIDDTTNSDSFGRMYSEKIIKYIPLLLLTPGTPSFMTSYNEKQKKTVLEKIFTGLSTGELDSLINESSGKYYSLKFAYKDYFYYVNAMLRSAAFFLGIEEEQIDGVPLKSFNWLTYNGDEDGDIFGNDGIKKFLGPYAGAIPMYVDAGTSVDDSFSNNTTTSQLAGQLNGLSDMGRELNFLVGNVGGMAGLQLDRMTSSENLIQNIQNVNEQIDGLLGKGNIISNIVNKAQTILAGGRMLFPEIWSDSSFSRSYSCKMKLVSPSGDKLSIYLNILVPIFFLLGFVLPRQSSGQAYFSPFLCRGYYKSLFNIDMGIFTDFNITKGDEGEWTVDGLPTVADVSFTIKDLYDGMFMSKMGVGNDCIMSNITELDYIANSCGININEPATIRTIKMYYTLGFVDKIKDAVSLGIFTGATQFLNGKLQNIFGKF